jgi:hypothetical protein
MIDVRRVQSLSEFSSPLLTVYVNTSAAERHRHGLHPEIVAWLRQEERAILHRLPPPEQESFREQLSRVEIFLRGRIIRERSLLIFAGPTTWEIVPLQTDLENELHWGPPALAQFLWLTSRHKPCGVVVLDRDGVRFFKYWLGEMTLLKERTFEIDTSAWKKQDLGHVARPGIQKTHGIQRDTFEHRIDAQYARICRETADQVKLLFEKDNLAAFFLVGSARLVKPIEAEFSREFRDRVVLIEESLTRLSARALLQCLATEFADWEQRYESRKVSMLLDDRRDAILGLGEVLVQLQKDRVRMVVLAEDFNPGLHQCEKCHWVDDSADPLCPICGGERRILKLREILPGLLQAHSTLIEVIGGGAAAKLKAMGGIGAWFRQPNEAELSHTARKSA